MGHQSDDERTKNPIGGGLETRKAKVEWKLFLTGLKKNSINSETSDIFLE